MNTSSRVISGEYLQGLHVQQTIISNKGSPGGSSYENLELDLVKLFNPNRREIKAPEYRRGVKDPNTTQWQRGPMGRTAKLVKVFATSRLDFGQRVGKGIPTGSRL